MYNLQPIEIVAESETTYRVRFMTAKGESEYIFKIEEAPFPLLVSDDEFLELTNGDPAADRLKQAICNFHQARYFSYAKETKEMSA